MEITPQALHAIPADGRGNGTDMPTGAMLRLLKLIATGLEVFEQELPQ